MVLLCTARLRVVSSWSRDVIAADGIAKVGAPGSICQIWGCPSSGTPKNEGQQSGRRPPPSSQPARPAAGPPLRPRCRRLKERKSWPAWQVRAGSSASISTLLGRRLRCTPTDARRYYCSSTSGDPEELAASHQRTDVGVVNGIPRRRMRPHLGESHSASASPCEEESA